MRLEDTLHERSASRFLVAGDLVLDRADQRAWLSLSPLSLGAKALALLEELMRHPQMLVTKERLFEVGWPDQAVSDAVLTTAIREIRRTLDDPARTPVWIETHHGKGYRFLKDVDARAVHPGRQAEPAEKISAEPEQRSLERKSRRRLLISSTIVGALVLIGFAVSSYFGSDDAAVSDQLAAMHKADRTLVAILPFEADGVDPWVADAFVSQIGNLLGQTETIFVTDVGRKGRFGPGLDGIAAAHEAGIPQVVTGTIGKEGERTVARLRLVSTLTGKPLWEERFAGEPGHLLPTLENASIAVARSLRPLIRRNELARMAELGTHSVLALEEFEKGARIIDEMSVHASRQRTEVGFSHLEQALEYDPSFARAAYLLTSQRWTTFFTAFHDPDSNIEDAFAQHLELLDIAIINAPNDIDRTLYEAKKASALVRLNDSVTLLEEYLHHRPNDLSAISDMISAYARVGNWEGVSTMLDRLAELEMARGITPLTTAYYFPHDRGRAKQWADRLAAANTSDFEKTFAVDLYLAAGEKEAAYGAMDAIDLNAVSALRRNLLQLQRLCSGGKHDEGRRLAQQLLKRSDWRDGSVMAYVVTGSPDYDLTQVLPSDETAAGRALLARYLFSPWFDYTQFPRLVDVLRQQGIHDRTVTTAPFACRVPQGKPHKASHLNLGRPG